MPEKKERLFDSVDEFFHARYTPGEHQSLYDAALERLRGLEKAIASAAGQLVLVVRRESEVVERGQTGCFGSTPDWTNTKEYFALGVLTSSRLILCVTEESLENGGTYWDSDISLPTERHSSAWYGMGWRTDLKDGPIKESTLTPYVLYLDEPLTRDASFFKPKKRLEVIAGNGKIDAWAKREHHELLLRKMLAELGENITLLYVEEAVKRERTRLAASVEQLWLDLMRYRRRVDAVSKAGREGLGIISLDGISLTVCENDDDAFWVSYGDRQRAEAARGKLEKTLTELKECGGVSDDLPDVHLIRHVAEKINFDWE